MTIVATLWIRILRFLSFGWWERERARMRGEEAKAAERWVNARRAEWIGRGFGQGLLEAERQRGFRS